MKRSHDSSKFDYALSENQVAPPKGPVVIVFSVLIYGALFAIFGAGAVLAFILGLAPSVWMEILSGVFLLLAILAGWRVVRAIND